MTDSQFATLDDEVLFPQVTDQSPEFYYCESQRLALESLLSAGPSAFYTRLNLERIQSFLSRKEISKLHSLAQDFSVAESPQLNGSQTDQQGDLSVCYWPSSSDFPTPNLDLGWPEGGLWRGVAQARVLTHPPTDKDQPIREFLRRLIQGALKLVAIVMDKLTDRDIFRDLLNTSRRGIPVYILLSQQEEVESFLEMAETVIGVRLSGNENMRVRTVSGCTFLSRDGRTVTGKLKEKFILIDDTVITGSCSLTWSDAHLHRQLVTVLNGQVVDAFDKEFRTLYACSLPIPQSDRPAQVEHELLALPQTSDSAIYSNSSGLSFTAHSPPKFDTPGSPTPPLNLHPQLGTPRIGVFPPTTPANEMAAPAPPLYDGHRNLPEDLPIYRREGGQYAKNAIHRDLAPRERISMPFVGDTRPHFRIDQPPKINAHPPLVLSVPWNLRHRGTSGSSALSDILKGLRPRVPSTNAAALRGPKTTAGGIGASRGGSRSLWDLSRMSDSDSSDEGKSKGRTLAVNRLAQGADSLRGGPKVTPAMALIQHREEETRGVTPNSLYRSSAFLPPRPSVLLQTEKMDRSTDGLKSWASPNSKPPPY
ncbi:FA83E protein, partial [Polypterus senegalus]|nr:protein FAM83E [Polypterus senegalus]MBN3291592.1 FA83E protein [Polypterus senegalus]